MNDACNDSPSVVATRTGGELVLAFHESSIRRWSVWTIWIWVSCWLRHWPRWSIEIGEALLIAKYPSYPSSKKSEPPQTTRKNSGPTRTFATTSMKEPNLNLNRLIQFESILLPQDCVDKEDLTEICRLQKYDSLVENIPGRLHPHEEFPKIVARNILQFTQKKINAQ